jgi:hypothetical protein
MQTLRKEPTMAPTNVLAATTTQTGNLENITLTCFNLSISYTRAQFSARKPRPIKETNRMKITPVFFVISVLCAASASASIEVKAELVNSTEKKEAGAADTKDDAAKGAAPGAGAAGPAGAPKGVSQEKALKITVHNASAKPEAGLIVRYWFIGRDMKTMKAALLDGGESTTELKPNGTTVVTSDPVKSSYTMRSSFASKGGDAKGGAKPAPPEAGGTKISGYGAQVIKADKVVAQFFSEPAYQSVVGSGGNKPGPLFKAAKPEDAPAP